MDEDVDEINIEWEPEDEIWLAYVGSELVGCAEEYNDAYSLALEWLYSL